MCAMMEKFRMNLGSIFSVTGFLCYSQEFESTVWFFRRACLRRALRGRARLVRDTRSAKTMPCEDSVCHKSRSASARAKRQGEMLEEIRRAGTAIIPYRNREAA